MKNQDMNLLSIPKENSKNSLYCTYSNNAEQPQVIRLVTLNRQTWERTIYPDQSIYFEANEEDYLEIHNCALVTIIHSDTLCCKELCAPSSHHSPYNLL